MAERFLVLTAAAGSSSLDSLEAATRIAGAQVDKDRHARLIVRVVGEVKPRSEPNVDVVLFDQVEAASGA